MRRLLTVLGWPLTILAAKIVLSNDDGWAEKNIRVFYSALNAAGNDVVLSAPAENQSGTSSSDETPSIIDESGCEFGSCPSGSPPYGYNRSDPRINYVGSYPVTSMKHGIQNLSAAFFDSMPDLAVAGPNVGSNLGVVTQISGTVGAACAAANLGVPAIAFSGASGQPSAWNTATQTYQAVYAELSSTIASALLNSGKPYLPGNIFLNVNYPEVTDKACPRASDFNFVLSRINYPLFADDDVQHCGSVRLPTESDVVDTTGCYVSISVGDSNSKLDADASDQAVVLGKLGSMLSCLSAASATPTFTTTSATASASSSSGSSSKTSAAAHIASRPAQQLHLLTLVAVLNAAGYLFLIHT